MRAARAYPLSSFETHRAVDKCRLCDAPQDEVDTGTARADIRPKRATSRAARSDLILGDDGGFAAEPVVDPEAQNLVHDHGGVRQGRAERLRVRQGGPIEIEEL